MNNEGDRTNGYKRLRRVGERNRGGRNRGGKRRYYLPAKDGADGQRQGRQRRILNNRDRGSIYALKSIGQRLYRRSQNTTARRGSFSVVPSLFACIHSTYKRVSLCHGRRFSIVDHKWGTSCCCSADLFFLSLSLSLHPTPLLPSFHDQHCGIEKQYSFLEISQCSGTYCCSFCLFHLNRDKEPRSSDLI